MLVLAQPMVPTKTIFHTFASFLRTPFHPLQNLKSKETTKKITQKKEKTPCYSTNLPQLQLNFYDFYRLFLGGNHLKTLTSQWASPIFFGPPPTGSFAPSDSASDVDRHDVDPHVLRQQLANPRRVTGGRFYPFLWEKMAMKNVYIAV